MEVVQESLRLGVFCKKRCEVCANDGNTYSSSMSVLRISLAESLVLCAVLLEECLHLQGTASNPVL